MGIGEVLLILVIALIIWGPEKMPEIANTLGRMARALKKVTFDLTSAVTEESKPKEKDRSSQPTANNDDKDKQPSAGDRAKASDTETTSPRDQ